MGEILARARKHAKLSQAAVARESGLSKGELSQIERGTRADPRFSTIAKLAHIVGVSLDQVAYEMGHRKGHRPVAPDLKMAEELRARELLTAGIAHIETSLSEFRNALTIISAKERRAKRKS